MEDRLNEIYQTMLNESEDKMTVGSVKPGELEGADKNGAPVKQVTTKDNTVDAPKEGASAVEVKKGGATANSDSAKNELEGKKKKMPKEIVKDSAEVKATKFEDLYKSVIGEDLDLEGGTDEIVKAPEVEGEEFNDEEGDFEAEGEGDVEDEVDVASELRAMSERMLELADKYAELTGETGGDDLEGELGGDELGGDELGGDELGGDEMGGDELRQESMKNQPEPKPAKKTTLGPKMSKTVTGKLSSVGKKSAKGNIKGTYDGVPQKFGDKGSKTNQSGMTAKGNGSAHKKGAEFFAK
jgi:hypothetical protein